MMMPEDRFKEKMELDKYEIGVGITSKGNHEPMKQLRWLNYKQLSVIK